MAACSALGFGENKLVKGAIIGKAFLYDVIRYATMDVLLRDRHKHFLIAPDIKSDHSFKRYGFLVKDAVKFKEEIPYPGKLGFFEVSDLNIF